MIIKMLNEFDFSLLKASFYKYSFYFKLNLFEFRINDFYWVLFRIRLQKNSNDLRIANVDIIFANQFILLISIKKWLTTTIHTLQKNLKVIFM